MKKTEFELVEQVLTFVVVHGKRIGELKWCSNGWIGSFYTPQGGHVSVSAPPKKEKLEAGQITYEAWKQAA
jgi:hypothetical protein